jgi:hypothetical protein
MGTKWGGRACEVAAVSEACERIMGTECGGLVHEDAA